MKNIEIGIIGGSGIYQMGLESKKEVNLKTPFGDPSGTIVTGILSGRQVAFLPRHGPGHKILPSEINNRANIYALKSLGVEYIISISACGSLKEELKPRDFIIPDQLFDRTKSRPSTFFGNGIVGHVSFAHPFCPDLSKIIYETAKELNIKVHSGGTYVCIEGPQFSTKAESEVNRKLGFSVVGMTVLPEAKLAREAEICYTTIGLITDYDVWKEGGEVTIGEVVENMKSNTQNVKRLIKECVACVTALPSLKERKCECATACKYAVFTQKKYLDKTILKKLNLLIGKYIK